MSVIALALYVLGRYYIKEPLVSLTRMGPCHSLRRTFFLLFFLPDSLIVWRKSGEENHLYKLQRVDFFVVVVHSILLQPEKFAHNLVLYVQGLGKLSSLPVTGSWNARSRTTSQSE